MAWWHPFDLNGARNPPTVLLGLHHPTLEDVKLPGGTAAAFDSPCKRRVREPADVVLRSTLKVHLFSPVNLHEGPVSNQNARKGPVRWRV